MIAVDGWWHDVGHLNTHRPTREYSFHHHEGDILNREYCANMFAFARARNEVGSWVKLINIAAIVLGISTIYYTAYIGCVVPVLLTFTGFKSSRNPLDRYH